MVFEFFHFEILRTGVHDTPNIGVLYKKNTPAAN